MKRLFFVVLLIAILASFFASSNPDGLEKVAEHLGFIHKAAERGALLPDYTTPGLPEGGISTATAGIAGVLITMSIFWLAAYALKMQNGAHRKEAK
jgi:hypothetical protein